MEQRAESVPVVKNPAKTGYEWFVQASIDAPSSHYGQAARILELARLAGYEDPRPFGDALRADADLVRAARNAALSRHRGVKGAPKIPHQLNDDVIKGVVNTDYRRAGELMVLKTEQLSEIWKVIVPMHSDVEDVNMRDDVIGIEVRRMIAEAQPGEAVAA